VTSFRPRGVAPAGPRGWYRSRSAARVISRNTSSAVCSHSTSGSREGIHPAFHAMFSGRQLLRGSQAPRDGDGGRDAAGSYEDDADREQRLGDEAVA